jgi:hypothetical protein
VETCIREAGFLLLEKNLRPSSKPIGFEGHVLDESIVRLLRRRSVDDRRGSQALEDKSGKQGFLWLDKVAQPVLDSFFWNRTDL